jgi:hypothetical protein
MTGNRKKKRLPYRAAIISLAVAALTLAILAATLGPLWSVHRASQNMPPRSAAPKPLIK